MLLCVTGLSVLVSIVLSFLAGEKCAAGIKARRTLATAVLSCLVMLGCLAVLKDRVTVYEGLFVSAACALLLELLAWPGLWHKNLSQKHVLKLTCFFAVLAAVYSILTYGQVLIHGDTATASLLTKAQLEHGSFFPESWYYVNGEIWFVSLQLFIAPFVMVLEDQSLARMLGSVLLLVVASGVVWVHSKKLFGTDSWLLVVPLIFIFISGERDMILYQAAYVSPIIFLIMGVVCGFRIYVRRPGFGKYVCMGAALVLLLAGGLRYLAEMILPLWLTMMVLNYLEIRQCEVPAWKQIWKEWVRLTAAVMVPAALGLAVFLFLKRSLHVINSAHNSLILVSSVGDCVENVFLYVINLFKCFGFQGGAQLVSVEGIWSMCSVLMCGIVVFVVPVLQAWKLRQESQYVRFFFAFTVVHNLVLFVLAVFLRGKNETRYLLTSVFLWILLSSRYIYVYWIRQAHFEKYIWTGLFVLATAVGCLQLGLSGAGWQSSLASKTALVEQLTERGLQKGYADFWEAYPYEVHSDFELRFGGLEMYEKDFVAHFWLVDGEVFTPEDTDTFLLLSDEDNERYAGLLQEKFQAPVDYFTYDGNHIYVFDYDIAVDLIK